MKQTSSVTMTSETNAALLNHLIRDDGDEDLCFALYNPSNGYKRFTAIICEAILPLAGDRQVHGNVSFNPCFYERVLSIAKQKGMGIAFIHSHPGKGFQQMSSDDVKAEKQMAGAVKSVTGFSLLGMTTGNDGTWSARFWHKSKKTKRKYQIQWCESVRIIGNNLKLDFNDRLLKANFDEDALARTISAWGLKTQKDISRVKVAIVGLGSVGSMIAECLARTGFANFILIDFDIIENRNRDRGMNIRKRDVGKLKIDVIAKAIKENGTANKVIVDCYPNSIYDEAAYKAAISSDVIFSCVDRPHARQILNSIAYAHLIPVIDGGIKVRTNKTNTKLVGADWKIQTIGYDRPCLECLEQYTSVLASLDKEGFLDKENYIHNADESIKAVLGSENVFSFSMNVASLEVLQLLSLLTLPEYLAKRKQQFYHFTLGKFEDEEKKKCSDKCLNKSIIATGDSSGMNMYRKYEDSLLNTHLAQVS
jgi:molybdopterin/thiamine biosynthesis adenylyltransferase